MADVVLGSTQAGPGDGDNSGSIREYDAGSTNIADTRIFSQRDVIINQTTGPTSLLGNGIPYKSMPSSSAHFVGREGYIDNLKDFFKKRSGKSLARRTMVLHGLGGAGKTQIALKFIEDNEDLFWETFWIDASSEETIKASLSTIASNPIAKQAGIEANSASVLAWLDACPEEWLLVFDGADQDPSFISQFLTAKNHGNILVSTRNPNMASVAGQATEIMDMSPPEALTLLLKSALPHITSYSPEMEEQAAAIAEELCFMPLAIDQAGAAIRSGLAPLSGYLALHKKHRTKLPVDPTLESQPKYDCALYTTWDISFGAILSSDKPASTAAIALIRTFSFMHYEGIAEDFFRRAALCKERPHNHESPLDTPIPNSSLLNDILRVDSNNEWDPLVFREGMKLLLSYSFVKPTNTNSVYTMHRLVHAWVRDRMSAEEQILSIRSIRSVFEWVLLGCNLNDDFVLHRAITPHVIIHFDLVQEYFPQWNRLTEMSGGLILPLGILFSAMGHYRRAMDYLKDALELEELHPEPDQLTLLSIQAFISLAYTGMGEHQQALGLNLRILDVRRRLLGPDHPDTLTSMSDLASSYRVMGELQKAKELQEQALDAQRKLLGPDHPNTYSSLVNLGLIYRDMGEYERAKDLQEQVLDGARKLFGPDHPKTLTLMNNLAITYSTLGQYQDAKELQKQVLDAQRRLLGSDHPNTLLSISNLASIYSDIGQYQDAKELQKQVLDAQRQLLGSDHPDTLLSTGNLASIYSDLGQYQDAKELGEQVLDARGRLLGSDHPDTLASMNNLACTYSKLGQYQDAKDLQERVLDVWRKLLGPDHPNTLISIINLASTYSKLGQHQDAQDLLEQAVTGLRKTLGREHPLTCRAQANLRVAAQVASLSRRKSDIGKSTSTTARPEPLYKRLLSHFL